MELNIKISVMLCPLDMGEAGLPLAVTCGRLGHGPVYQGHLKGFLEQVSGQLNEKTPVQSCWEFTRQSLARGHISIGREKILVFLLCNLPRIPMDRVFPHVYIEMPKNTNSCLAAIPIL